MRKQRKRSFTLKEKTSISAFTIVELLVSMIISSILLVMSWNVYIFLNQYKSRLEEKSSGVIKDSQVEYWMKKDMASAEAAKLDDDQNLMIYGLRDTVVYTFTNRMLYRKVKEVEDSISIRGRFIQEDSQSNKLSVILESRKSPIYFNLEWQESSTTLIKHRK